MCSASLLSSRLLVALMASPSTEMLGVAPAAEIVAERIDAGRRRADWYFLKKSSVPSNVMLFAGTQVS